MTRLVSLSIALVAARDEPAAGGGWVILGLVVLALLVAIAIFGWEDVLKVIGALIVGAVAIWAVSLAWPDDGERCEGPAYDSTAFCYDESP